MNFGSFLADYGEILVLAGIGPTTITFTLHKIVFQGEYIKNSGFRPSHPSKNNLSLDSHTCLQ